MVTKLGIDATKLGVIGAGWQDGGLWDDVLWLAARAWEDGAPQERLCRWHHLVMAVGNFKRDGGRRLHPSNVAPVQMTFASERPVFDVPGFGALDRENAETWRQLPLTGAGTATRTTLFSALWPGQHHVLDRRVFAATTALLLGTDDDLGLVGASHTNNLKPPTIENYVAIRPHLRAVATEAVLPLIVVERALYRLARNVDSGSDLRWSTYQGNLLQLARDWPERAEPSSEDSYEHGDDDPTTV
jgi:hypothetical protein